MEKVSFRKCAGYELRAVKDAVSALLEQLGGAASYFKRGANVLLKPNMLRSDRKLKGVITHPVVVRAVAEIAIDNGSSVKIGDSPGIGTVAGIYSGCGFGDYFADLPLKIVEFRDPVDIKNEKGGLHKNFTVDREILDADAVINLPKVKTHGQMLLSLAVKNMFGSVVGIRKPQWHLNCGMDSENFADMLVSLHYALNPSLSIIDGIVGMEGNGPSAGEERELGFLAASRDASSLDIAVCRVLGIEPERLYTVKSAAKLGFIEKIEIPECLGDPWQTFSVPDFRFPVIQPPETLGIADFMGGFLKNALTVRPVIDRAVCTLCETCIKQCPAKVMRLEGEKGKDRRVEIAYRKCIRCFCCQEICPDEAIGIGRGWMLKAFSLMKGFRK